MTLDSPPIFCPAREYAHAVVKPERVPVVGGGRESPTGTNGVGVGGLVIVCSCVGILGIVSSIGVMNGYLGGAPLITPSIPRWWFSINWRSVTHPVPAASNFWSGDR